jgi:hypothetical protein
MNDEPSGPESAGHLERITEQDVHAITEKFKSWITTLPEQEQLVMGWILSRATAAPEDLDLTVLSARAAAGVPVSTLMARAAGLQDFPVQFPPQTIGPVTVWTFRF